MSKPRSKAAVTWDNPIKVLIASVSRADVLFVLVIIALAFLIRFISLTDNGITSDEPIYVASGIKYIENILRLDLNNPYWGSNLEHPPVSKYLYGAAATLVYNAADPIIMFTAAKMVSLVMGVLTCVLVYLIGREFFSRNAGFTAAVILALLPTFVAHTQIAALESPLAFFVTLAMFLYMLAIKNESRNLFLASAIAFGLVIATKYNGLIILPVMAAFYLIYRLGQIKSREGQLNLGILKANMARLAPVESILTFMGIAVILFFALWPLLWTGPVPHLLQSLSHWTYDITEYFLGTRVVPPVYYYPVYFAVTLPALLFLPLIIGMWDTVRSRDAFKLGIALWFIIPFAYNFSSFIQDGIRYIFIVYPAVALLCALGLVKAAEWVAKVAGAKFSAVNPARVFWTLAALTIVYLLVVIASFYPYYLDYYNEFTGGPSNVQEHRLFKFGWWGEGIKECMDWVGETSAPDATVLLLTFPQEPANNAFYTHGRQYYFASYNDSFTKNQVYRFTQQPYMLNTSGEVREVVPDYVIINQKMREDNNVTIDDPGYRLVYQATVQGAPLAQVYRKASG